MSWKSWKYASTRARGEPTPDARADESIAAALRRRARISTRSGSALADSILRQNVRPTTRMGRTPGTGASSPSTTPGGAVAPIWKIEADATDDVTGVREPDRRAEKRRRHPDLADPAPDLGPADPSVGTRHRDTHRDRLDGDEVGRTERDRVAERALNWFTNGRAIGTSLMSRLNDEMYAPGTLNSSELNVPSVPKKAPV